MEYYELYIPQVIYAAEIKKRDYRPPVIWSDEKLDLIKGKFSTTFNNDLALELGCGCRTVIRKAREFGLEKEVGFSDKRRPEIIKRSTAVKRPNPTKGLKGWVVPGGEKFQFKKGHVPASKNNPEIAKKMKDSRNNLIRRERIRLYYGLEPLTKIKLRIRN